jgi:hypothetical protein
MSANPEPAKIVFYRRIEGEGKKEREREREERTMARVNLPRRAVTAALIPLASMRELLAHYAG